jgi:hypothetical protein
VERVTLHGSQLVPGMKTKNIRLGTRPLPEAELLIHELAEARRIAPSISGILGMSALASFNFTLLPGTNRLDHGSPRPEGQSVPFRRLESGRIAVTARMGSEPLTLILDSGSTNVVLFGLPAAMAKTPPVPSVIATLEGARSAVPTRWTRDLFFGDQLRLGMLPAAIVERDNRKAQGLLPASAFRKIYVDQSRNELVLIP